MICCFPPPHPDKLLHEKRVGFLLCFSLTRVRQHYTNRNRSSLRFLLCLSSWRLKLSSSFNISSLGKTITGSRLVPICRHLTDSQVCQYLKTLNFKRKTFQVKSTVFDYSIRNYDTLSHILKIKDINKAPFNFPFRTTERGKSERSPLNSAFTLKKKKVPKTTQITASPFKICWQISPLPTSYSELQVKVDIQAAFYFLSRHRCSSINLALFSSPLRVLPLMQVLSDTLPACFFLLAFVPKALYPPAPGEALFKSITSSPALSLGPFIGMLISTAWYCVSLSSDTLYPMNPHPPSHSSRLQTAAARFYGNIFLLLNKIHPWHFWRAGPADFLDFLLTAAAKPYPLLH